MPSLRQTRKRDNLLFPDRTISQNRQEEHAKTEQNKFNFFRAKDMPLPYIFCIGMKTIIDSFDDFKKERGDAVRKLTNSHLVNIDKHPHPQHTSVSSLFSESNTFSINNS